MRRASAAQGSSTHLATQECKIWQTKHTAVFRKFFRKMRCIMWRHRLDVGPLYNAISQRPRHALLPRRISEFRNPFSSLKNFKGPNGLSILKSLIHMGVRRSESIYTHSETLLCDSEMDSYIMGFDVQNRFTHILKHCCAILKCTHT